MKNRKKELKYLIYIFLISFIFITIGSKNSFLYKFNDWYDANAFMTMGRGLLNGLIPYKDLFEQKGPILYFLYAVAALINNSSFIGAYILELITYSIFLYYVKKTLNLFFDDKYTITSLIILSSFIVTLKPFGHGGAAEELCLPFFMYSIYSFIKYLRTGKITVKEIILNGIMAGIIAWVKYSLLGFHFVFAATLFFVDIFKKKYLRSFLNCIYFLLGMGIVTLPVILYFVKNSAVGSLIDVYFLANMTSYSEKMTIIEKMIKAIGLLFSNLFTNPGFLIMILIPIVIGFIKKINFNIKYSKYILLVSFIFMGLGTFIGGTNYFYYSLIITPFMVLGVILINYLFNKYNIRINNIRNITVLLIAILIVFITSDNIHYMFKSKNEYAQYIFADIINKSDDKTLINYGFLDGGFYLTTNTLPDCYYFMRNNFTYDNFKEMYLEQKRFVKEEKPHYVVTRRRFIFLDNANYKVIQVYSQIYENEKITYYLYERQD